MCLSQLHRPHCFLVRLRADQGYFRLCNCHGCADKQGAIVGEQAAPLAGSCVPRTHALCTAALSHGACIEMHFVVTLRLVAGLRGALPEEAIADPEGCIAGVLFEFAAMRPAMFEVCDAYLLVVAIARRMWSTPRVFASGSGVGTGAGAGVGVCWVATPHPHLRPSTPTSVCMYEW